MRKKRFANAGRALVAIVLISGLCLTQSSCGKQKRNGAETTPSAQTGGPPPSIWIVMDSIAAGLGPTRLEQDLIGVALPSYKIVERVKCGDNPREPTIGTGSVWVFNYGDDTLTRIDPRKGKAVATIKAPYGAEGFALGKATAWVANDRNGVTRLDLASGKTVAEVPTDIGPQQVAVTDDAVWVTHMSFSVVRVDPATNKKVATVVTKVDGMPVIPLDIAATRSAVWVATNKGVILRIDPSTNHIVATIKGLAGVSDIGAALGGIARVVTGEGGVWAVTQKGDSVARIDPASNRVVARIKVSAPIRDLATGHGAVWVLHGQNGALARIDPGSNRATNAMQFGKTARALAVGGSGP